MPLSGARLEIVEKTKGFMPPDEGQALHRAALLAVNSADGPLVEIGTYCAKSSVYLGDAAETASRILFSIDHHRGSEENQAGWEHHDNELVDPALGRMDTLPWARRTLQEAALEDSVVLMVGDASAIGRTWRAPLSFLFIDGGHGRQPAWDDYRLWTPHLACGAVLAIHDVFPDESEGGRPPFEIFTAAVGSGLFQELKDLGCGSLRVLRRLGDGAPPTDASGVGPNP